MNTIDNSVQTLAQKRGEVAFRRLISRQHRGIKTYFAAEYGREEILRELRKRITATARDFGKLQQTVQISPFLEIGAEYCIRSSYITDVLHLPGVALDISQSSLAAAPWFSDKFGFKKLPTRVVADAHRLPFPDESFPFVFCYQTLHHFPNPLPVIKEILRVLTPGGNFFFAEEPISQTLNLNLFRRPTKVRGALMLLKVIPILPFISKIGKTEADFGIHEGTISFAEWKNIFSLFEVRQMDIDAFLFGRLKSFHPKEVSANFPTPALWQSLLLGIFGGGISALLTKKTNSQKSVRQKKISRVLYVCPDCRITLLTYPNRLICTTCHRKFYLKRGIQELLPKSLTN